MKAASDFQQQQKCQHFQLHQTNLALKSANRFLNFQVKLICWLIIFGLMPSIGGPVRIKELFSLEKAGEMSGAFLFAAAASIHFQAAGFCCQSFRT